MISCTSWVPRGVADPNPKRFEFSRPELEMIKELERESERSIRNKKDDDEDEKSDGDRGHGDGGDADLGAGEVDGAAKKKEERTTDLPKEFRMDEYSSSSDDDDDEDGGGAEASVGGATGRKVGNLLVGVNESEMMVMDRHSSDEEEEDEDDEEEKEGGDDAEDSDDDDDLDDVEDGREYLPVDVGGMQSMRLGGDETLNFAGGGIDDDDDDDSDLEDTNLMADDALLLVAKTDEDFSSLEVYVYEQNGSGNLFVHHDIPLPSYPLCLAHGDINHRGEAGNFCAVGMFTPGIEIWNLDVLDALEPACVLGGSSDGDYGTTLPVMPGTGKSKKKKKKARGSGLREGSHTDAVMALSWNAVHRHVIASGSADRTVKIWDVTRAGGSEGDGDGLSGGTPPATPAATFRHHNDKVQGVAWHPVEGTILATGSFDRTVTIVDARCKDGGGGDGHVNGAGTGRLPADCEAIAWDPHRTQCLSVASEDGTVTCWDIRKFGGGNEGTGGGVGGRRCGDDAALWSFVAHEFGGVSDLSYNSHVPGLMATCAIDKTVALWDTHNLSTSKMSSSSLSPHPCGSKDMGVGKLYSVSFYPSSSWLLGCGGGGNQPALWDLEGVEAIQKRFGECPRGGVMEKEKLSSQQHDVKDDVVDFDEIMTGTAGNTTNDDAGVTPADRVREKMEKKMKKDSGGKRRKKKAHRR